MVLGFILFKTPFKSFMAPLKSKAPRELAPVLLSIFPTQRERPNRRNESLKIRSFSLPAMNLLSITYELHLTCILSLLKLFNSDVREMLSDLKYKIYFQ